MPPRLAAGAALAVVSGALLVVSLFIDWWSYPPAFDAPTLLPDPLRPVAEAVIAGPQARQFDAFRFFSYRDVLWLVAGVVGFAYGAFALALRHPLEPLGALSLMLGLGAAAFVLGSLVSPPDYANLAPGDFSVELPLGREAGIYLALVGSLGIMLGASLTPGTGPKEEPTEAFGTLGRWYRRWLELSPLKNALIASAVGLAAWIPVSLLLLDATAVETTVVAVLGVLIAAFAGLIDDIKRW